MLKKKPAKHVVHVEGIEVDEFCHKLEALLKVLRKAEAMFAELSPFDTDYDLAEAESSVQMASGDIEGTLDRDKVVIVAYTESDWEAEHSRNLV